MTTVNRSLLWSLLVGLSGCVPSAYVVPQGSAPAAGCWTITQTDSAGRVVCNGTWTTSQAGVSVNGAAQWDCIGPATISGTSDGQGVDLSLAYDNHQGLVGHYQARFTADYNALVGGTTQSNQGAVANWTAVRCGSAPMAVSPPPPNPVP